MLQKLQGGNTSPLPPAGLAPGGVSDHRGPEAGLCGRACTNGGSGRCGIDRARNWRRGIPFQGERDPFSWVNFSKKMR